MNITKNEEKMWNFTKTKSGRESALICIFYLWIILCTGLAFVLKIPNFPQPNASRNAYLLSGIIPQKHFSINILLIILQFQLSFGFLLVFLMGFSSLITCFKDFSFCVSFFVFPGGLVIRAWSTSTPNRKPKKSCLISGFCKNLKLGTEFIKSFLEVDKLFRKFCANLGWIQSQPEPINFLAGKTVTYDGWVYARWLYITMGDFGWIWLWTYWRFPPTGTKCDSGLAEFCPLRFLAGSFVCCHFISQAEHVLIRYWTFSHLC